MKRILSVAVVCTLFAVAGGCDSEATETTEDAPLAAGACRGEADCDQSFEQCQAPGFVQVCGGAGCPENQCNADIDCVTAGSGDVCLTRQGVRFCEPGCGTDNPCAAHQTCETSLRCEPKSCAGDSECPDNFSCSPNICLRTLCDDDAPCDGFCVNGACHAEAGRCEENPA